MEAVTYGHQLVIRPGWAAQGQCLQAFFQLSY
jgi:hypothetical protein